MRLHSRSSLVALIVLAAALVALSGCIVRGATTGSGQAPINTVTAAGEGKALGAPDTAEMTFGASQSGTDPDVVLDEAAKISKAIVDAVKKAGIADDDIQTTGVNLYPQYDYSGVSVSRVVGYEGSVSVQVTVRDVAKLGDIIAAAGNAGATNISGPAWRLDEDSEQTKLAIENAVSDARTRAEVMAAAVGKSVGKVVSINETGVSTPILYGDMSVTDAGAERLGNVPIEAGNLEILANVTVVFELK